MPNIDYQRPLEIFNEETEESEQCKLVYQNNTYVVVENLLGMIRTFKRFDCRIQSSYRPSYKNLILQNSGSMI